MGVFSEVLMNELKELENQIDKLNTIEIINERMKLYAKRYSNSKQMLLHLLPFVMRLLTEKKKKVVSSASPKRLKILIDFEEGLGGIIISLNWVCYFYNKFCKGHNIDIDCSASFSKNVLEHFVPDFVNKIFLADVEEEKYDLKIIIARCPQIAYADLDKIKKFSPALCETITRYIVVEKKYGMYFRISYKRDAITYNVPSSNIKRWHQPDILDLFNMTEEFILPIKMPDEATTLKKFKLEKKKYITLNREVGAERNISPKLWPVKNYEKLIEKLKVSFPQYKIVEVGTGKGAPMKNVHLNLAGKTSLEEIKVILKNSLLHIDGEGGLVHLRHALKAGPSCVLFGPTSPKVFGYSENINLSSNACPICCELYDEEWAKECVRGTDCICMKALTPDFVFSKVAEYLSSLK